MTGREARWVLRVEVLPGPAAGPPEAAMAPPSAAEAVAGGEAAGRHLAAPPHLGRRAGSVRPVPLSPRENELSGFVLNSPEVQEQN